MSRQRPDTGRGEGDAAASASQLGAVLANRRRGRDVLDPLAALAIDCHTGVVGATIMVTEHRDEALTVVDLGGSSDAVRELERRLVEAQAAAGLAAVAGGEPVPVEVDGRHADDYARAGVRGGLALPVCFEGQACGALTMYGESAQLGEHNLAAARRFADHVGYVLDNLQALSDCDELTEQLHRALRSRAVIDQAIGVALARDGGDPDAALQRLKQVSMRTNRPVREIAARLVESASGGAPADGTAAAAERAGSDGRATPG